ncbi:MAG: hypothetical protein A2W19_10080 [Spirochaetes bacterium RBG_16_49_21]|nr:MAG: hypothetical protein A2W19_10080 [Spirochaetes bacterium RBG_16_49_21]
MKRTILFIGIPLIIAFYFAFIISRNACDYVMANHPAKPIPFNHKAHLTKYGAGPDCTYCHGYYDNGRFKGLPTVAECTSCHDRQGPDKSADPTVPLRKPVLSRYKDSDKPWGSHAKQPPLAYFSHKVVMTAKFEDGRNKAMCAGSCHGDKANSTDTSMLKGKMLMGRCEDCHAALRISNKCAVCHN